MQPDCCKVVTNSRRGCQTEKAKQAPGLFQPQPPESAQQCAVSLSLRKGKKQQKNPSRQSSHAALAHLGPEALGRKPAHRVISALAARQGQQAGLRSNSRVENQQMSFQAPELLPRAGREAPDWQVKFCLVQPSASVSLEERLWKSSLCFLQLYQ